MSTLTFSYSFLSFFMLATIFSLPLASSKYCNKADMMTLLKIKNSFGNPSLLVSWNSSDAANCCSFWRGIGCNADGRITSIGIVDTNVTGPIPSSIVNLSALNTIYLFNLPNLVGPIPSSIAKLTSLTQLTISSTSLSGNIPSFLSNLPNLNDLDLSGNQLTGPIPRSFANINFRRIVLSHNNITGDASFLFGVAKSSLDLINLSWNELEFDLSSVRFPLSMEQMDLSHNKIGGSIPQQIIKLNMLSFIDVSYNMLCGPIPKLTAYSPVPSSFEQNKCLCGEPLPPCRRSLKV